MQPVGSVVESDISLDLHSGLTISALSVDAVIEVRGVVIIEKDASIDFRRYPMVRWEVYEQAAPLGIMHDQTHEFYRSRV